MFVMTEQSERPPARRKMRMNQCLCALIVSAALLFQSDAALAAAGTTYPLKPIRLVVPTTAGSSPDQLARLLAEPLASVLGQPVLVDNRPGASGTIGINIVAKAPPDGYTLGIQTLPFIVAPSLLGSAPYDTERDLAPIVLVNWNHSVLVVTGTSTIRSVAELVQRAR